MAGRGIAAAAYHERSNRVMVWDHERGELTSYNLSLEAVGKPARLPLDRAFALPAHLAVDPTGNVAYYNHAGSDSVFRFDTERSRALTPLRTSALRAPADMVMDNGGRLYVSSHRSDQVLTFSGGRLDRSSPAAKARASGSIALTRGSRRPLIEKYEGGDTNADAPFEDEKAAKTREVLPAREAVVPLPDVRESAGSAAPVFRRGDCDGDGIVGLSDGLFNLSSLVSRGEAPSCLDACDVNGDGRNNISDTLYLFSFLFGDGAPPPAPFPACGTRVEGAGSPGCEASTCE